jgi:hypothetical protein
MTSPTTNIGNNYQRRFAAAVSIAIIALFWSSRATAAGPPYNGGRVLSNVQVVVVFWTNAVNATVRANIGPFFSRVTNSQYMDWLSEYDTTSSPGGTSGTNQAIGRGSLVGTYTITPTAANSGTITASGVSLQDAQISAELAAQISLGTANGGLPGPNANTLYMVYFPPNYFIFNSPAGNSCNTGTNLCGYHNNSNSSGQDIVYASIFDFTPGNRCTCAQGSQYVDTTTVSSHELMEATTDPDLFTGWSTGGGTEIGEQGCVVAPGNADERTLPTGDVVQAVWSNRYQACVAGWASGSIVGAVAGKCIDDPGFSTTDGTNLEYYDCNGGANQQWQVTNYSAIIGSNGGKCMDLPGFNTTNGTDIQYYTCNAGTNQLWTPTNMEIRGYGNKCIDLPGGNTTNGTGLEYYDCNGGSNQQWTFTRSQGGEIRGPGNKCWDLPGGNTTNGTQIQYYDCNGGSNQVFLLGSGGTIRSNGKCVDLPGFNTTNKTQVQIYDCNQGGNQKWSLDGQIIGYGNKCVDLPGSQTANKTQIQYYDCNGGSNQRWWFQP